LRQWLPLISEELMKKVRFTEEQMVMILREADKSPVAEVAKKHKISEQTIYVWRRRFGKLEPADVKRLRELETENAKLKRMVAETEMAIETLKEINRRKSKLQRQVPRRVPEYGMVLQPYRSARHDRNLASPLR
jgi:putative transposase